MNNTLTLSPALDAIELSISNDPNLAPSSKDKYIKTWQHAKLNVQDLTDPGQVSAYFRALSPSARLKFSAVFGRAVEIWKKQIRSGVTIAEVTPELFAKMQVAMWQMDDLRDATPTHKTEGEKLHIWLSQTEVDRITSLPDRNTLQGRRDYIVLATLLGAGPRREELSELTFSSLLRLPNKGGYRDTISIYGKGEKFRTVPISPLLSERIREWEAETGGGNVARSISKAGVLGDSLSAIGIFDIVRKYGAMIGHPALDPHDCRRSFGRLGYEATHDIILIRDLLGHVDVKTTMKYIGLNIKLDITASDFIIRPVDYFMQVSGD
jgi:integrase